MPRDAAASPFSAQRPPDAPPPPRRQRLGHPRGHACGRRGPRPGVATSAVTNSRNSSGLAVGHEVGLAARPLAGRRAPGPRPRCRRGSSRSGAGLRRSRRSCPARTASSRPGSIVVSPGPHTKRGRMHHRLQRRRSGRTRLLGPRLGARVVRRRVGAERGPSRRRSPAAGRPTARPRCPRARSRLTPAARQPSSTLRVPVTLPSTKSSQGPHCLHRRGGVEGRARSRCGPRPAMARSPRSPFTGSAPSARTASAELSERASARTVHARRRTRRRISAPPMKPDPPVTNARSAIAFRP